MFALSLSTAELSWFDYYYWRLNVDAPTNWKERNARGKIMITNSLQTSAAADDDDADVDAAVVISHLD